MKIILTEKEVKSILGVVMDVQEELTRDNSQEAELKIIEMQSIVKRYIANKTNVEEKYISICWHDCSIIVEINDELVSDSVNLFGKFIVKIVKALRPLMGLFVNKELQEEINRLSNKWHI